MTENPQDKSSLCGKLMSQGEELVWEAFKTIFHLHDNFNSSGRLRFLWDNRRRDGCRILARLDRHYVSSSPGSNIHLPTRNYAIRGDCPASDHLLVTIDVILQDTIPRVSCYKMSSFYLKHPDETATVKQIWDTESCGSGNFFSRLTKFTCYYRNFCKTQAMDARRKETKARTTLSLAQEVL